ncbi:HPr kinase/phosphorylase [Alsobacter sp. R-9]
MTRPPSAVHATCVLVGEAGILLRGPSGAGKSTLARRIVEEAGRRGRFARLVADDRVLLDCANGRLTARPHAAIAGAMEVRGSGIAAVSHDPAAVIRLVVDVGGAAPPRLPDDEHRRVTIGGLQLPRVEARDDQPDLVLLVLDAAWPPPVPGGTADSRSAF